MKNLWLNVLTLAGALLPASLVAATFQPSKTTNDYNNPHKGFMVWGTDYAAGAPLNYYGATIYHIYVPWREIETADQVFDWGRFETNHLKPILTANSNATFVLRPVADYPDGQGSGITLFYAGGELTRDFPAFLTNAPFSIPAYPYTSCDGDGPGMTPDWNHPAMITQLVQFVQAFAQRYDGDPRITAIQVGLLGLWGEWHQSGCASRMPSNAVKVAVRNAYASAFTNTPLQTRYARDPDVIGVNFGFHEDYFPSFTAQCIYGFPTCSDSGDWSLFYGYKNVSPTATNHWRYNPISGESPNTAQKRAWSNDFDDVMTVLREYHFSFLGPAGGHEMNGNQVKLNAMKRQLGYNYHIEHVEWPDSLYLGHETAVAITFTNSGAAPCYHPFPVELAICQPDGTPVWRWKTAMDLRLCLPGMYRSLTNIFVITNINEGIYSLRIGILDPRTGQPGIRIQSAGEDSYRRIAIGNLEIRDPSTADSDGDGLPDDWEYHFFGGFTNATATADPDGDGQSNWEHYINGTNPTNPASYFVLSAGPVEPVPTFAVSSMVHRLYALERTTSMIHAVWIAAVSNRPGTGGVMDFEDPCEVSPAFYRARVTLP